MSSSNSKWSDISFVSSDIHTTNTFSDITFSTSNTHNSYVSLGEVIERLERIEKAVGIPYINSYESSRLREKYEELQKKYEEYKELENEILTWDVLTSKYYK